MRIFNKVLCRILQWIQKSQYTNDQKCNEFCIVHHPHSYGIGFRVWKKNQNLPSSSAVAEIDISMCVILFCYCFTVGGNVVWNHNQNIACNWFSIFMQNKWRPITTTRTDTHPICIWILQQWCVQRLKWCIDFGLFGWNPKELCVQCT